jgi:hypothetical protein
VSIKKYGTGEVTGVDHEPEELPRRTASWSQDDERELEEENRDDTSED